MQRPSGQARTATIAVALALVVVAVYARVGGFEFVDFDDGAYVYANPYVREGLTARGIAWAFTTAHSANWHPLTWLSHMLDVQLFGLDAGGHHWTNVALHAANTVLLFLVLRGMTGADGRSALVAVLFGVHPLHVESVAWIAERKDVLSTLFWLLAIAAYARYVQRPALSRYLSVVACHALGLLCKPMLVTVPATLLLLDVWPLGRWRAAGSAHAAPFWSRAWPLVREKLPLFAVSLASAVVTYRAQAASAATGTLEFYPLVQRVANAVVAYAVYLLKTVWPSGLAAFYPHPSSVGESVSIGAFLGAAALLTAISALAVLQLRRRPYVAVGWAWFLGTLVPVIGLVQVGSQAYADRYTYVPLIGVFVAVSWGCVDLFGASVLAASAFGRRVLAVAAAIPVLALSAVSVAQVGYWRDGTALYERALAVTDDNWLAWNNLGNQHLARDELDRALECFERAVAIFPDYGEAWYNAGVVHYRRGERERAIECYRKALSHDPRNIDAWNNLGVAYLNLGSYAEAVTSLESALGIDSSYPMTLQNLALTHALRGDRRLCDEFERRLRAVDPARADELLAQLAALRR